MGGGEQVVVVEAGANADIPRPVQVQRSWSETVPPDFGQRVSIGSSIGAASTNASA